MEASQSSTHRSRRPGLRAAFTPRDMSITASAGTWLALGGGTFNLVMFLLVPGFAEGTAGRWITLGASVPPIALGLAGWRIPSRVPIWAWSLLPFYAVVATVGAALATRDASTGSQIFLVWPVIFAAYLLSGALAWLTYVAAGAGDLVIVVALRPPAMVSNGAAVLVTLALMTLVLIKARDDVDRALGTLSDQAMRDPLTHLANRRSFDGALTRALARSQRTSSPVCLLAVDLDRLKAINDADGHPSGDAALVAVARTMRTILRAEDRIARLGGDEFAAILGGCPPADGVVLAERVLEAIRRNPDATSRPITVSIGIACFPDDAASAEELLTAADRALYDAKRSGRDCLRTYAQSAG